MEQLKTDLWRLYWPMEKNIKITLVITQLMGEELNKFMF